MNNENINSLERFCRATGLRRHELFLLTPDDVYLDKYGHTIVIVQRGKGGKSRYVVSLNDFPLEIAERARANGDARLFPRIPANAPTHFWRGEYARALYAQLARPVDQIPREDQYRCRAELAGLILDRAAMHIVSKNLGHNRVGVTTLYIL